MQALCISDALDLYMVLKPHLPEKPDESGIRYVKDIVDSMAEKNPQDYLDSILLMTGMTEDELEKGYSTIEIRDMFVDGLVTNQIASLADFGRTLKL